MTSILEHTENFAEVASRTIHDMFGVTVSGHTEAEEAISVQTSKTFMVSIYYTGTVYGEYLLAMDEETAAEISGFEEPITDENREEVRECICDALSETLNTIVGESIVHLQKSYAKLTITAPRIYFGEVRYPKFQTGKTTLTTQAGNIECHFCLDLMRLDLATSYQEAMGTLLDVNVKLKEANQHLAEQQAQLVLTEKMASVGILASGVAHEINNPLFFVDANLTTLGEYVNVIESIFSLYDKLCESLHGADGGWSDDLKQIHEENELQDIEFVMQDTKHLMHESREGITRIKDIVQGLRDFSQVDRGGFAEADINVITENACGLVATNMPKGAKIEKEFSEVPKFVCNAAEIGQVVSSVLLNAGHAIGENGRIIVRSEATESDIILIAEDDGHGIDAKHIDHIFEPFYSTRDEGNGTGLGLSIAYGIVQKHNGSISVNSTVGEGTKVTIRLPMSQTPAKLDSATA